MNRQWSTMLVDVLSQVFKYLSFRDRMACFLVCSQWREALDNPIIWKSVALYVDTDLFEPSTSNLLRMYGHYVKHLKLSLKNQNLRWSGERFHLLTKVIVRFLLVFIRTGVQLQSFKLVAWFDMHWFKKVKYHLSRFLRTQQSLQEVSFSHLNLVAVEPLKLLLECGNSQNTVRVIRIMNCYCNVAVPNNFNFFEIVKCFPFVTTLQVDYPVLCGEMIYLISRGKMSLLKWLTVFVKDNDHLRAEICEEEWHAASFLHPLLRVTFCFHPGCHYDHLNFFLKKHVPIISISISCCGCQGEHMDVAQFLSLVQSKYKKTIETLHLHHLTDMNFFFCAIPGFFIKCSNLKQVIFHEALNASKPLAIMCRMTAEGILQNGIPGYSKNRINIVSKSNMLIIDDYRAPRGDHNKGCVVTIVNEKKEKLKSLEQ